MTPLIESREKRNYRDPAILALQWATGGRPQSELWNLKWRHIEDFGDHLEVSIPEDTKTGRRRVFVYVGAPYVRRWREHHPENDGDGPPSGSHLWTKLNEDEPVAYAQYAYPFYWARDDVGVSKPCNPQNFRRSRARAC